MKRLIWLILLAAAVACGPAGQAEPTATSPAGAAAATEVPAAAPATVAPAATGAAEAPSDPGDFAVATSIEAASTVRDTDQVKGARDGRIVLYEYSDFQ